MTNRPAAADDGTFCPLWRKSRHKVCHTCAWWMQVIGKNPQTGHDVNQWNCAITFMPMLQIETTMAERHTTQTVDELRKEVKESHDVAMVGSLHRLNERMDRANGVVQLEPSQTPRLLEK